jgi:hypothetical protein
MARQSVLSQKKRGPPATGKGTLIGVRMQPPDLSALDEWVAAQNDKPSRPERFAGCSDKFLEKSADIIGRFGSWVNFAKSWWQR